MRAFALAVVAVFPLGAVALPPVAIRSPRPVPAKPVAFSPQAVRDAVAKSLPMLIKGAEGHSEKRGCFTCHHHAMPVLALATARDRGFDVPKEKLASIVEFITEDLERNRTRFARGQGPGPSPAGGETDNTGYALFALDVAGHAPDKTTEIVVEYTLGRDAKRDHWATHGQRPPSEASSFATTALCIRAVQRFAATGQRERAARRVDAAREWLLKTKPKDTEDRVFRLLGLKAAGAADRDLESAADDLRKTQRGDGGWSQLESMPSDAYATGSALVALHLAGNLKTDNPVYRRGATFLLGTQRGDGTWHVKTRSRPIQTYIETGFPHGKDQFISCHATSWAATALALACPKP